MIRAAFGSTGFHDTKRWMQAVRHGVQVGLSRKVIWMQHCNIRNIRALYRMAIFFCFQQTHGGYCEASRVAVPSANTAGTVHGLKIPPLAVVEER